MPQTLAQLATNEDDARLRAVEQLRSEAEDVIWDYTGRRGPKTRVRKRPGKLPTLDTMGSHGPEGTDLEFNWQRNGLRALRPNPL
jgi:hypothetical protein